MFSPRSTILRSLALFAAGCWLAAPSAAVELSVMLDRLEAPGLAAGPIVVRLTDGAPAVLQLTIGEISLQGQRWRNVRATCADFVWERGRVECRKGEADVGTRIPLSFVYASREQTLEVVLRPSAGEAWTLKGRLGELAPSLRLEIENGSVAQLAQWLPADWPKFTAGLLVGVITLDGAGLDRLAAELTVREASFSDASGLHAAETLGFRLRLAAQRKAKSWAYRASLDWDAGELFWQPLYLRGAGYTLSADGVID
ncbi:MAG: hypothetical protein OEN48_12930, partial [Betaproteobacteria bacterium]|nr:hypothetical protein [Betaproteobacteria bacterium]